MRGKNQKKAVVLLSGGLDSAVAGAWAKRQGRELYALTLGYGQQHRREILAARAQARALEARRHEILEIPLAWIAAGDLLAWKSRRGDQPVAPTSEAGKRLKKNFIPATYVTFRNGVFLSLAFSFAEAVGASEVWGGWCRTDHSGYPDCRPAFFRAMEKAAVLGTKAGSQEHRTLCIVAPLAGLSKEQTVRKGRSLAVDFAKTWSCYAGGKAPCGVCDACKFRADGFEKAGIRDPLKPFAI